MKIIEKNINTNFCTKKDIIDVINSHRANNRNVWINYKLTYNKTDYSIKTYNNRLLISHKVINTTYTRDNDNHLGTNEQYNLYLNTHLR